MRPQSSTRKVECPLLALLVLCIALGSPAAVRPEAADKGLSDILHYISSGWNTLTRSLTNCDTFRAPGADTSPVLYLPANFSVPAALENSERGCPLDVRHLPVVIQRLGQIDPNSLRPAGLLYLPYPYVVSGGRFNEMYGWDSYFIIRGLIEDGRLDLAKGMVRNFFFEIEQCGGVLNANRTYFLSRSQPPFLTSMIRAVYDAQKARGKSDRAWLEEAYPYAVKDYELWTHAPHLADDTGFSRDYDFGDGPAPELGATTEDYYSGAVRYFLLHPSEDHGYLARGNQRDQVGPVFSLLLCAPNDPLAPPQGCKAVEKVGLAPAFYRGDRAMRESGFDVSFRFGPYGAATTDYAPVGLNSLLYKEEDDLEWMSQKLGHARQASQWRERAVQRRNHFDRYFWNPQRGLFFDYNFRTKMQSSYAYASTFFPLWVGLASPAQARAVEANLKVFAEPGGIVMSTRRTGAQWDYPYGWAPIQLIALEGLRRYGDGTDANRISSEFLSMVLENFRRDGTIREKYNVVTRSSETHVEVGYRTNVTGFGWTNGVFLVLLHELPKVALSDLK